MKCFTPIDIKLRIPIWSKYDNKFINSVPVGCGKCHACIQRKISEWTFRLDQERVSSHVTYFVTLTYNNLHVPINQYGKMTLDKNDLQLFIKRLRQHQKRNSDNNLWEAFYYQVDLTKEKISYYAVGEYGSEKFRPHYHLVLFNASKEAIRKAWELGEVDIQQPRSSQALGYVVKYLSKRIYKITPKNVKPEFSLMSKGIGYIYIEKNKQFHKKNMDILYTFNQTHSKIPMSKFYRDNLFTESEKDLQIPIIKKNLEELRAEEEARYGDSYNKVKDFQRMSFVRKIESKTRPRKEL